MHDASSKDFSQVLARQMVRAGVVKDLPDERFKVAIPLQRI